MRNRPFPTPTVNGVIPAVAPPRLGPLANHPRHNAVTDRILHPTPIPQRRSLSPPLSQASTAAADSVPVPSQHLRLTQP